MPKCCQCHCFKSYCLFALARYNYSRALGHGMGHSSRRGATSLPPLVLSSVARRSQYLSGYRWRHIGKRPFESTPITMWLFWLGGGIRLQHPIPPAYSVILWFSRAFEPCSFTLRFHGFRNDCWSDQSFGRFYIDFRHLWLSPSVLERIRQVSAFSQTGHPCPVVAHGHHQAPQWSLSQCWAST
jgi:hypothetical protein